MEKYLIDTNIIINILRGVDDYTDFLTSSPNIYISSVTVAELIQGCGDKSELKKIYRIIDSFETLHLTEEISLLSVKLLDKYFLSKNASYNDCLIASTAIRYDLFLITHNLKDFNYISGLKIAKV